MIKKSSLFTAQMILLAVVLGFSIASCKRSSMHPVKPDKDPGEKEAYKLNTDTTRSQYMVWWGGFNAIKMPLDSIPNGVNTVYLFLLALDPRPEVALDTMHITMQPGVTWSSILAGAQRLQKRGIKVVATIMAQVHRTTDTIPPHARSHGIPPTVQNQNFSIGAITNPEAYAATIKRKIIDEWKLDGVDFDCEEEVGAYGVYNTTYDAQGNEQIDHGQVSNAVAFFKAMSKYFGPKSGTGKLMDIDRGAEPMEIVPAAYPYFNHILFQAYNWSTSRVSTAYEQNKAYFKPENMYFTLNCQRARSGWDEDTDLVPDGFKEYGAKENAIRKANEFAEITLPSQSRTINMGIYQVAGDWSLQFPVTRTIFSYQNKPTDF